MNLIYCVSETAPPGAYYGNYNWIVSTILLLEVNFHMNKLLLILFFIIIISYFICCFFFYKK